jgi:molybdenum cofactor biosynthesis enzyme MoaA
MKFESILVELSSLCNLKCPLCARRYFKVEPNIIKPNDFENMKLHEVESMKQIQLGGYLGEPITNPYFFDICDITKKWNKNVIISTNGSFRSKDWWHELPSHLPKNHSIRFALDGTDDKTLNMYRKGSNYRKIIENTSAFIEGGGNAVWQMILFRHNEHQCEEAKQKSIEMGFKEYILLPSVYYNNEFPKPYRLKNIKSDLEYSTVKKQTDEKCRIELGRVVVSSKGEYVPCCFCFSSEIINEICNEPVKYIRDYSFKDIIEDGYYERVLKRVYSEQIESCSKCISYCGRRIYKIEDL